MVGRRNALCNVLRAGIHMHLKRVHICCISHEFLGDIFMTKFPSSRNIRKFGKVVWGCWVTPLPTLKALIKRQAKMPDQSSHDCLDFKSSFFL